MHVSCWRKVVCCVNWWVVLCELLGVLVWSCLCVSCSNWVCCWVDQWVACASLGNSWVCVHWLVLVGWCGAGRAGGLDGELRGLALTFFLQRLIRLSLL